MSLSKTYGAVLASALLAMAFIGASSATAEQQLCVKT